MGHKCDYFGVVKKRYNKIILEVTAKWKKRELDVIRYELESGKCYARPNIYSSAIAGYLVVFEGEYLPYYYDGGDSKKYDYEELYKPYNICIEYIQSMDKVKEIIVESYPKYKYICKKYKGQNVLELFELCRMSNEHKETELLVDMGFNKLALNKSFYRLSDKKKSELKKPLKDLIGNDYNLNIIRQYMKCKGTVEEFKKYVYFGYVSKYVSFEDFKYLETKNKEERVLWNDIRVMIMGTEKQNDPYWRYPKDVRKIHNKLLEIKKSMEKAKQQLTFDKLKKVTEKMIKDCNIKGYRVYVGKEYEDWDKHATELNQCILRCNYYDKVIKKEEVLIFIDEAETNKPVATAEIYKNGELGQFYGNEIDRNNCKPSQEIKEILMEFLSDFKVKFARA